eukprot:350674-Chlamydomonas_euryale.AAC.1
MQRTSRSARTMVRLRERGKRARIMFFDWFPSNANGSKQYTHFCYAVYHPNYAAWCRGCRHRSLAEWLALVLLAG